MRGFPLLQALLLALGMAALWGPLSATMRQDTAPAADSGTTADEAPGIEAGGQSSTLPARLNVKWTSPPSRLLVEVENEPLVDWNNQPPADALADRGWSLDLTLPGGDPVIDLWVEADWTGSAGREVVEVRVAPAGMEEKALVIWGDPEAVDGTTMSWKTAPP